MPSHLKWLLNKVEGWPKLKVEAWEIVARRYWKYKVKILSTDPRYGLVHSFVKNEAQKQRVREAKAEK